MADASKDPITLLSNDHREVKALFREFEGKGDRAQKAKVTLYQEIRQALETHTAIEEEIFYPGVRTAVDDMVAEGLEEHQQVKTLLKDLAGLDPSDERFDAKMTVLIENVEHHAEEEEKEMFPQVRQALKPAQLEALGTQMAQRKQALQSTLRKAG